MYVIGGDYPAMMSRIYSYEQTWNVRKRLQGPYCIQNYLVEFSSCKNVKRLNVLIVDG